MDIHVRNNVLYVPFRRGIQIVIPLDGEDIDLDIFDEYLCQVKEVKSLDAEAVLSYSLGNGIELNDNTITLTIEELESKTLDLNTYWFDIKVRNTGEPFLLLMEGKLINEETVTEQPT